MTKIVSLIAFSALISCGSCGKFDMRLYTCGRPNPGFLSRCAVSSGLAHRDLLGAVRLRSPCRLVNVHCSSGGHDFCPCRMVLRQQLEFCLRYRMRQPNWSPTLTILPQQSIMTNTSTHTLPICVTWLATTASWRISLLPNYRGRLGLTC